MFSSDAVKKVLADLNVLVVTADNTDGGETIKKDLARADRKSLPANLIYPADPSKPAIILPEYLTPEIVIKALRLAAEQ